jgi:Zn-dependent protease
MGLDLSPENLRMVVVNLIILILSISVHEFGHAIVAYKLGDRLPKYEGRVTLNPVVHADPIGTLALPTISMLLGSPIGFGWGRPVRVNPAAFTRKLRMRTAHLLVALAGPAMNILFGLLISLVLLILVKTGVLTLGSPVFMAVFGAVIMNFLLAFFNLIPAKPLDGGTVLEGLLPDRFQPAYAEYCKYSLFVVIAFFMIPQLRFLYQAPAIFLATNWIDLIGITS